MGEFTGGVVVTVVFAAHAPCHMPHGQDKPAPSSRQPTQRELMRQAGQVQHPKQQLQGPVRAFSRPTYALLAGVLWSRRVQTQYKLGFWEPLKFSKRVWGKRPERLRRKSRNGG